MQAHQRRTLLANALDVSPLSGSVTRSTVEAALWHTLGWAADELAVSRLLAVIDSHTDSMVRRAITRWVMEGHGNEVPSPPDPAQMAATRRFLQQIGSTQAGSAARVVSHSRPPARPAAAQPPAHPPARVLRPIARLEPEPVPALEARMLSLLPPEPPVPASHVEPVAGSGPAHGADAVIAAHGDEEMHHCTGCNGDFPRSQFYADKTRKSGIARRCKTCKSADGKRQRLERAKRANADFGSGLTPQLDFTGSSEPDTAA
jgi:hypothetical protein